MADPDALLAETCDTRRMLLATLLVAAALSEPPVDVFAGGAGGYAVYRIPSVTRLESGAAKGRLLAFAEARSSLHDVTDNDLVMRTSSDGGATWSEQRVVAELPGRSLNNPTVVELSTGARAGRILLMFQSYPERCGESAVVPGFDVSADAPDRVCRTMLVHSDDGGATWSTPREITRSVKRPAPVTSTATGPGIGIELRHGAHKGRILMPFNQGPYDQWRVYAAISDDGGDSWRMGDCAPDDERGVANEVQMFERADGTVVLNARQHLGARRRKTASSADGGETWTRLADVPELPDPQCMAGVLSLDGTTVVFTGCDSESRRALGSMWISRDGGRTWPEKMLVESGGFAYSVPVALEAGKVGVLYETAGYRSIAFRTVSVPSAAAAPAAR